MKIGLVRHGQTEENFLGKVQGRENNLMNDTGRRQCQRLRQNVLETQYDYCYMSPMVRCVETAFILVGDKVETIPDERLVEREMGEMEGRPRVEYNAYQFWNYTLNRSDFGIEPVQDVFKRSLEFLNYIKEKHKDQNILIVTHGSPYRAIRHLLKGTELKGSLLDGNIDNCQYEVFEIE